MIEKVCTKCGAKWLFGNDNHNECPECDGELRKKTNADSVRAMSDEELASFIERTMYKIYESAAKALHIDGFEEHWDKDVIVKEELEWLKQEVSDDS